MTKSASKTPLANLRLTILLATSASMALPVSAADDTSTRWGHAQQRAFELIDAIDAGSKNCGVVLFGGSTVQSLNAMNGETARATLPTVVLADAPDAQAELGDQPRGPNSPLAEAITAALAMTAAEGVIVVLTDSVPDDEAKVQAAIESTKLPFVFIQVGDEQLTATYLDVVQGDLANAHAVEYELQSSFSGAVDMVESALHDKIDIDTTNADADARA